MESVFIDGFFMPGNSSEIHSHSTSSDVNQDNRTEMDAGFARTNNSSSDIAKLKATSINLTIKVLMRWRTHSKGLEALLKTLKTLLT